MAEYYAHRTCDICGETVAIKRKFVFAPRQPYRKMKFKGDKEAHFFCKSCCMDVVCELQSKIGEEKDNG